MLFDRILEPSYSTPLNSAAKISRSGKLGFTDLALVIKTLSEI